MRFFGPIYGLNMHESRTFRSSSRGLEKAKIRAKGGILMNRLIARLIDCGMTRDVAVCMMRQYRGRPHEFELYVESVEAECHEQMEEL